MDESDNRRWVAAALQRFEGPLVRYARRLLGDLDSARDAVQETFLRLCRQQPQRLDGHLAEWLYTVCRSRALDQRRKRGRETSMTVTYEGQTMADPLEQAEVRDSSRQLLELLRDLPPRQQEILRLKFHDGLSYRQIAQVMRLSESNVGFLIHTAIKNLRDAMRR